MELLEKRILDIKIKNVIKKIYKKIKGPYPADSAFNKIKKNTLIYIYLS